MSAAASLAAGCPRSGPTSTSPTHVTMPVTRPCHLQVSDEGGGIPRSGLPKIWTYLYTTAKSPLDDMRNGNGGSSDGPSVLAG